LNDIETGIMLYLDYVIRQLRKDKTFEPHPIIKAIALALEASKDKADGNYMGLSGIPVGKDSFSEMYAAIVKKEKEHYTILSIEDVTMRGEIPADIVVQLLHISMRLDEFEGDSVEISQALRILNDIVTDVEFKVLPSEEIEDAKRNMIEQVKAGKVIIPKEFEHLIDCLKDFRMETSWEKLDSSLRALIGTLWSMKKYPGQRTVIITQDIGKMKKHHVIELAKSRLLMRRRSPEP